eukprot:952121-Pleurochrysis_carterae.AAC.7
MSQPAGMPPGCVFPGVAERALAGLAAAVQAPERADHTMAALETSTQSQTLLPGTGRQWLEAMGSTSDV